MRHFLSYFSNCAFYFSISIIVILLLLSISTYSQTDTSSILINEVIITSRIEKLNSENNIQEIDTNIINNITSESLSVLLSEYSNVSIKSYGVSGISTLSIRGGASEHTAVIWNGFNIQNPLNGGFDFNLSSNIIADNIKIKYGGSSAIYGSGAMGGAIQLSNNVIFNKGVNNTTLFSLGSFGKINLQEKISWSNKKMIFVVKGFYNKSDNNFPYTNISKIGYPIDTLNNAKVEQSGIVFENYVQITKRQLLSAHLWLQKKYAQVPPNMLSKEKSAEQYDNCNRLALNWNYIKNKVNIEARSGLFYTDLNYINDNLNLNVYHASLNNINEIIADFRLVKMSEVEFAVNNNFTRAVSDNFLNKEQLNKTALFTSFKSKIIPRTIININGRVEVVDGVLKPITFGAFAEYSVTKSFLINTNLSKNHRSPNFNDLYWQGAFAQGNKHLKDENGYTTDISFIEKNKIGRLTINNKLSVFYNKTDNMIQWIPLGNIWTPSNQKEVKSRGVELFSKTHFSFSKQSIFYVNINYSYINAQITKKTNIESDDVIGKQLIYTPLHQSNLFVSYRYKDITLSINTKYTGEQYTRSNNKDSISSYTLVNIFANYKIALKTVSCIAFVKINNVLNIDYVQRQWYPMPPMNFETGLTIKIN